MTTESETNEVVATTEESTVLDSYANKNVETQAEFTKGETIDKTLEKDFDPETQKIIEYKMVTISTTGEGVEQIVRKIEDKTAEEIESEKQLKEDLAISEKIKSLKCKVAI